MSKYVISKNIDLSDEFDELTAKDQKEFIKDKFDEFIMADQQKMLCDLLGFMPNAHIASILKEAFDDLSGQAQADVYEYIKDIMGD